MPFEIRRPPPLSMPGVRLSGVVDRTPPRVSGKLDVLSLLHFDGPNGSTTFVDEVPGREWVKSGGGTPQISTAQSMFGGSSYMGALGTVIALQSPGQEWFMPGDFSIQAYVRATDNGGLSSIFSIYTTDGVGALLNVNSSTTVGITVGAAASRSIGDGAGSLYGRWVHAFGGRKGNTTFIACNGVMMAVPGDLLNMTGAVTSVSFGGQANIGGGAPSLFIDELQVVKGTCLWTSNFTPPTGPLANP